MKRFFLVLVAVFLSTAGTTRDNVTELQRVLRATVPTPGIEFELPLSSNSTMLMTSAIGIGWRYDPWEKKFEYMLFPSTRLSFRHFYNFHSRVSRNRRIAGNSGNFVSFDFLTTFEDFYRTEEIGTKDYISFTLMPKWGIQRAFGSFHLSCSVGPGLYFDTKGRQGFSWFFLTFRIGFDLTRW